MALDDADSTAAYTVVIHLHQFLMVANSRKAKSGFNGGLRKLGVAVLEERGQPQQKFTISDLFAK